MKHLLSKLHINRHILYCLLTAWLFSCSTKDPEPKLDGWYLKCYYDNGWSWTTVKCDSLQMISITEAIVYVNGKETKIVGEELRPLHY